MTPAAGLGTVVVIPFLNRERVQLSAYLAMSSPASTGLPGLTSTSDSIPSCPHKQLFPFSWLPSPIFYHPSGRHLGLMATVTINPLAVISRGSQPQLSLLDRAFERAVDDRNAPRLAVQFKENSSRTVAWASPTVRRRITNVLPGSISTKSSSPGFGPQGKPCGQGHDITVFCLCSAKS